MSNLKYDDTVRSFLFGLADLINRYDNVEFSYTTDDNGIYVTVNDTEIKLGYGLDITPPNLHRIANSHDGGNKV